MCRREVAQSRFAGNPFIVPEGRVELPLSYENTALNRARLPIPPLRHVLLPPRFTRTGLTLSVITYFVRKLSVEQFQHRGKQY